MHMKRICILLLLDVMVQCIRIKSFFNESFKTSASLLFFYLYDVSVCISWVLKSPTIIVLLSISPFVCMYLDAPMLRAYMLSCLSHIRLFATLKTVTCQGPLLMGFSR